MEHQTELSLSARSMILQSLLQTKEQFEEELLQSTLTLTTQILKSGLRYENLKGMLTDKALTYINAQLLVTSLCESLSSEIQKLEISGVNLLENEKQLASRISSLKEIQTKQIQKHIKKTD